MILKRHPFTAIHAFIVVLSLTLSSLSHASAMVWKATKNGNTVYLGGTFHMLKVSDYPLPIEYEVAYKDSDALYFETDMKQLMSPAGQAKMLAKMRQPAGRTLADELSPHSYQMLKAFIQEKGMHMSRFESFRASMVIISASTMELAKLGVNPMSGVEMYFLQKSIADGKPASGLVDIDRHLDLLTNLAGDNTDEAIIKSLKEIDQIPQIFQHIVTAWKIADLETLDKLFIDEMKIYPSVYDTLLVQRNKEWAQLIDQYVKNPATEYILVGAAHLVGEDSVQNMLIERGFAVEQLQVKFEKGQTEKLPH